MFIEKEVDYVIDMMKNKYKDFKRSEIMRPFHVKACQTLKTLLEEQSLVPMYYRLHDSYKEITIENTMKLLIRCKLTFNARAMLIGIMKSIITYEVHA
jgi:hypothetical protein